MAYGRYPRSSDDVEEASVPRIRRAERLLDMLDGQEKSTRARSVSPDPDDARALSVPKRRPARAVGEDACREEVANGGNPAVLSPAILSVTPEGEGDALSVVLSLPAEADGGRPRRVKVHLLTEQYADLRGEGLTLTPGAVSAEQADALLEAGALCDAIRRGLGLLQYGDRSARRLTAGLTAKGISRETAEAAAAYLVRKGYIREEDTAARRAVQGLRKGWGPRRIREDLRAHGFEGDAVERAMASLEDVDFAEVCATVIRKKYGGLPGGDESAGERRKMVAALMRLGYDMEHIRGAMRSLS